MFSFNELVQMTGVSPRTFAVMAEIGHLLFKLGAAPASG